MKQVQENGACPRARRAEPISDITRIRNGKGNVQSLPPLKLSESLSRLFKSRRESDRQSAHAPSPNVLAAQPTHRGIACKQRDNLPVRIKGLLDDLGGLCDLGCEGGLSGVLERGRSRCRVRPTEARWRGGGRRRRRHGPGRDETQRTAEKGKNGDRARAGRATWRVSWGDIAKAKVAKPGTGGGSVLASLARAASAGEKKDAL